jgi:hypothetical protein
LAKSSSVDDLLAFAPERPARPEYPRLGVRQKATRSRGSRLRHALVVTVLAIAIVSLEVWALSQIPDPLPVASVDSGMPARAPEPMSEAHYAPLGVMRVFAANAPTAAAVSPAVSAPTVRAAGRRSETARRAQRATARRRKAPEPPPVDVPLVPSVFRGKLAIDTAPEGARVLVDGRPAGAAPVLLVDLLAGSRLVRIEAEGHEPWSGAVRVVADEQTSISVRLPPKGHR